MYTNFLLKCAILYAHTIKKKLSLLTDGRNTDQVSRDRPIFRHLFFNARLYNI